MSLDEQSEKTRAHRVSVELEVPFHDVDSQQIVWHGHYFKYLEIARTALLRQVLRSPLGDSLPYKWVVIESKCRHSYPLGFGDRLRVDAWLKDVEYRIHIAYEIFNLTAGRRAAKAHTMLATLDATGALLMNTPAEILNALKRESSGAAP